MTRNLTHESRLRAMLKDGEADAMAHWDLDAADKSAIRWVLDQIEGNPEARHPIPVELLRACEATLLFHRGGEWTDDDRLNWVSYTGMPFATTRVLCDTVRAAVKRVGEQS